MLAHFVPDWDDGRSSPMGLSRVNSSRQGEIRQRWSMPTWWECIVMRCPRSCSHGVQIPVSLWPAQGQVWQEVQEWPYPPPLSGEVLLIDARDLGYMENRTHRNLHHLRRRPDRRHPTTLGEVMPNRSAYADVPGFCASVTKEQIAEEWGYALSPDATSAPRKPKTTASVRRRRSRVQRRDSRGSRCERDFRFRLTQRLDRLLVPW